MGTINNFGNVLLPAGSNTINVQTLLNTAIAALDAPLTQLQNEQTTLQTQNSTLQSIENDISTLATAVTSLGDSSGGISALQATSSNTSILSATADSTAAIQNHSITVNSLATTSTYYTAPVATSSTAIATGSFTLSVGSNAPATITVDNTNNTLDGLASAINGQNLGVTASVVNDASGARLTIVSNTSGAASDITIANDTTGLGFTKAVTGANASLVVDGIPVSSATNSITGAIPGVTLNLTSASPNTTVGLSVTPNVSQAESAVNTFVSAWNTVAQDLNTQFSVASDGSGAQPLEADQTLRNVQQQLLSAITYSIGGNNGFVNLASIGLNMNTDGTITTDPTALSNALSNNFSSVQSLLQGTSGFSANLVSVLNQITDPTQGAITLDLQGMTQSNQDLTNQITAMQATLQTQEQNLTNQYDQMQVALQELPMTQSQLTQQLGAL
ncbi:MAG: flagellar filament capping protein FliD [Candidatus Acidiferrales bacterium]|jgi:flagellar hook-associated protein 2